VENLYEKGIRSFLFVNVPPIDRAPLFIAQGVAATLAVKASLADYNAQLSGQVQAFQARHEDLDQITVFDSNKLFNTLLDSAETLGWVNSTGFCEVYQVCT
jgi:phospholipase/lecithinase/hemolysin